MVWLVGALVLAWFALGPWVLVAAGLLLCVPRVRWWVLDRAYVTRRAALAAVGAVVAATVVVVVVPDGWLPVPPAPGVLVTPEYVGRPAASRAVAAGEVPAHPHLARNGASSVHADPWSTNASPWPGPLGLQPEVETAWFGLESCASLAFDSHDRLVATCDDRSGPSVHVVDPGSMRKRADLPLPDGESDETRDDPACARTPSYLDERDRLVVATAEREVVSVRTSDEDGDPDLAVEDTWDLRPWVPYGDCLVALMPDWSGRVWWASRGGLVGTVDPVAAASGADGAPSAVHVLDLGERISTSLSTDESGAVFVVTDTALHRLVAGADGTPQAAWRTAYDRGEGRKSGQVERGSGTAPTLLDGGVVAITDNADPRMDVVMLDRATGTEICRAPVFEEDTSASASGLVSLGSSVVVENNHGGSSALGTALGFTTSPGLARVDLADGECRVRWTSERAAPSSIARASWASGLVYTYTKRPSLAGVSAWYVTALDATSGRTMWSVRAGTGPLMADRGAGVALSPDGALWISTRAGLVRVRDRE